MRVRHQLSRTLHRVLTQLLVIVGNLEHVLAACRSPISTASARICSVR
jgi:hypothetical protein